MKLEEAIRLSKEIMEEVAPNCQLIEVVGSVRRKKPEVHDLDFIVLRNKFGQFLGASTEETIRRLGKIMKSGDKIIQIDYKGAQADFYICNTRQEYSVLKLIRTGSAKHNILLCSLAKDKGLQLKADGTGLINPSTKEVIAWKEEDILINLLGKYKEPEMRE